MVRISSITSTVLPTPAPPNIAALPPCAQRRQQVDDLDAGLEDGGGGGCASRAAAARDGSGARGMSAGSGGPPSRARPVTSSRRPSMASPTGTVIGAPVARDRDAALQALGACSATPRTVLLVEMGLNLDDERVGLIPRDDEGFVDPRKRRRQRQRRPRPLERR